ncbi:hypothetical protein NE237_001508 [Protea cynaroides]|uniref:Uncharacterized protein n=1 Tax=Protea cynaroides TaxID=273540 RepID=A0A9Q0KT79_9MAGN|nr:hypothetical protein NE237_001508 [Protea cynaroides]
MDLRQIWLAVKNLAGWIDLVGPGPTGGFWRLLLYLRHIFWLSSRVSNGPIKSCCLALTSDSHPCQPAIPSTTSLKHPHPCQPEEARLLFRQQISKFIFGTKESDLHLLLWKILVQIRSQKIKVSFSCFDFYYFLISPDVEKKIKERVK